MKNEEVSAMIDRIVELTRRRGHTQEALEGLAGLSKNRISKWVGGQGEPSARQLRRIARVLDTTIGYLLEGGDDAAAFTSVKGRILWLAEQLPPEEAIRRLLADTGKV